MNLRLVREPTLPNGATHGVLFVDGHYRCFTLEDAIRERPGQPVAVWKIKAQTAIPAGRYRVIITPSARFARPLPLLVDVPGFTGVRMHSGNGIGDTEGCILVGLDREPGRVMQSRLAMDALFPVIATAPGSIWITIEPPVTAAAPVTHWADGAGPRPGSDT